MVLKIFAAIGVVVVGLLAGMGIGIVCRALKDSDYGW